MRSPETLTIDTLADLREKIKQEREKLDKEFEEKLKEIDIPELIKKLKTENYKGGSSIVRVLGRLIFSLKEELSSYDTVLSDDASGRLPSLFLKEVILQKKEQLQKLSQRALPNDQEKPITNNHRSQLHTYFIGAGSNLHDYSYSSYDENRKQATEEQIRKSLERYQEELGKTLLVTEYISSGESIESFCKILREKGVDFNVAAVTMGYFYPDNYANLDKFLGKIKCGEDESSEGAALFNDKKHITGVVKNETSGYLERSSKRDSVAMKNAREDMKMLAHELFRLVE